MKSAKFDYFHCMSPVDDDNSGVTNTLNLIQNGDYSYVLLGLDHSNKI